LPKLHLATFVDSLLPPKFFGFFLHLKERKFYLFFAKFKPNMKRFASHICIYIMDVFLKIKEKGV